MPLTKTIQEQNKIFEELVIELNANYGVDEFRKYFASRDKAIIETVREECVETIKSYRIYDWSDEQAIYNQLEEIIERIQSL